jgi:hypothetical protein
MAGPMGRYDYVSDDGTTYTMRLDASNAAAVGANASASLGLTYPKGWVPRYLLVMHPTTRRERKIVFPEVGDPVNPLWGTPGGSLSLTDYATNAAQSFNIMGRVGERRYARA